MILARQGRHLVLHLFSLYHSPLPVFLLHRLLFYQQLLLPFLQCPLLLLKSVDFTLQLVHTLLSFSLLLHPVGNPFLIDSLVGRNSHFPLISDTHKDEPPFRGIKGDLPDNLVKSLGKYFFLDGTDPLRPGLQFKHGLLQLLLHQFHVLPLRLTVRHVLQIVQPVVDPLPRRKDDIEDV